MTREDLITSKEYVQSQIQLGLLNMIGGYLNDNKINQTELAQNLNVSKGYVSQILKAEYDHKISKLVELSIACKKVPLVYFVDMKEYVRNDNNDKIYDLIPMQRPKNVTYTNAFATNDVCFVEEDSEPVSVSTNKILNFSTETNYGGK